MKNYRPSTKTVVVGLVLMVVGILCWGIMAPLKENPHFFFLFPLGLLLLCLGGLELTITALVTMHKNDLAFRQNEKAKKAAEEKNKTK
ncbi:MULTISPECIES: hypothetical protein [Lactobacillus]|uniref:DUF3955 domain-containing protein n=1 Tax=Lactobacillus xujianguonis TaxID=2495899 RepID=A0A437SWS0_9LACO|nr:MULTISPECIES: hypothetical protein [Lactobacillus]RVU71332.1 hypothetical protein EJK17_02495 [Lactobacillus xujianguonis]RVU74035.1 hypothetical protein EJK20_05085 [Lactobacillus xujianguonis]